MKSGGASARLLFFFLLSVLAFALLRKSAGVHHRQQAGQEGALTARKPPPLFVLLSRLSLPFLPSSSTRASSPASASFLSLFSFYTASSHSPFSRARSKALHSDTPAARRAASDLRQRRRRGAQASSGSDSPVSFCASFLASPLSSTATLLASLAARLRSRFSRFVSEARCILCKGRALASLENGEAACEAPQACQDVQRVLFPSVGSLLSLPGFSLPGPRLLLPVSALPAFSSSALSTLPSSLSLKSSSPSLAAVSDPLSSPSAGVTHGLPRRTRSCKARRSRLGDSAAFFRASVSACESQSLSPPRPLSYLPNTSPQPLSSLPSWRPRLSSHAPPPSSRGLFFLHYPLASVPVCLRSASVTCEFRGRQGRDTFVFSVSAVAAAESNRRPSPRLHGERKTCTPPVASSSELHFSSSSSAFLPSSLRRRAALRAGGWTPKARGDCGAADRRPAGAHPVITNRGLSYRLVCLSRRLLFLVSPSLSPRPQCRSRRASSACRASAAAPARPLLSSVREASSCVSASPLFPLSSAGHGVSSLAAGAAHAAVGEGAARGRVKSRRVLKDGDAAGTPQGKGGDEGDAGRPCRAVRQGEGARSGRRRTGAQPEAASSGEETEEATGAGELSAEDSSSRSPTSSSPERGGGHPSVGGGDWARVGAAGASSPRRATREEESARGSASGDNVEPPDAPAQSGVPVRLSLREVGRRFRRAALQEMQRSQLTHGCFPVEAVLQHPELLNGMPFRRLGGVPPLRPQGASAPGSQGDSSRGAERRTSEAREGEKKDAARVAGREPRGERGEPSSCAGGRGMLVSGLCLGTSMFGSPAMIDDADAREMLHCAYGEYGINFFDVGELDPIPMAPATHGRGHVEVLRPFLRSHLARAASEAACGTSASSLAAEMRRIRISARILSGGYSGFREEREALKRAMRDEEARMGAAGALGASRWAWGEHNPDAVEADGSARKPPTGEAGDDVWSRERGWWARKDRAERRMNSAHIEEAVDDLLLRLGVDAVDLLQLDTPHRYVPRHELGEDTYCWGLEREDEVTIEQQLTILQRLIDKGKVLHIGLSNETPWGVYKWFSAAEQMGLSRVVSVQCLYNVMHRNEFESAGMPEMLWNLNVPLLAYGVLAGGILTGKYLDPERFNPRGPDERLGQDEWDGAVATYRTKLPEDSGYLSFGAANSRCNKWRDTFLPHRSVWAQWHMGELLKAARQFGLSAAQLALSWVYSRPFLGSAIIGPRTIGQLRDSVRSLNYPLPPALEAFLHELFLRFRAPTMGGPHAGTVLEDLEHDQLISQSEFLRWGRQPIWSGGTYWPHWPQPLVADKVDYLRKREELIELRAAAADTDDPSDEGAFNVRLWKEMLEDGRPGEYFAVKEQKLFGWDEKKFADMNWRNLTRSEQESQDHSDFHFVWRGDKIYRENTTEAMRKFYTNKKAICDVMHRNIQQFQDLYDNMERTPGLWCSMWNEWDYDLIDKRLRERHGIDILDKKVWKAVADIPDKKKRRRLEFTEPFWYWEDSGQPDMPWEHATGEDVADGGPQP
ncbi:oxidoreductase, aldo/keto reductase family protein [Besnoitia besnoiti]|uniref:Oxidoreductase, aldo/keto reductase family protein n=1 Tax=Besnoitia besnoiti TaxID=94643 RepID=A0A2A9MEN5_BESBE|nr:oxidoreductase, aldo/keto reductase family protein [Besnoitia besnoiti]PFH35674.1 oxidoreductase, aldo/keto reductase family protein [Besnoitia besnoiti]